MGCKCSSLWACCQPAKAPSVHPSAIETAETDPDSRNVIQKNFGEDITPQLGANTSNNKGAYASKFIKMFSPRIVHGLETFIVVNVLNVIKFEFQCSTLMEQPKPRRFIPVKKPVSLLTLLQLLVVVPAFVDLSIVLTLDNKYFKHEATRATVVVGWWILLFWLITIVFNIYAMLTNSYILLLPNILYCVLLLLPSIAIFITLIFNSSLSNWSVWASFFECCLVSMSIYKLTVAFLEMRERLGE